MGQEESHAENWQQDNSVDFCPICTIEFGILIRKHHCRLCGNIICDDCSRWKFEVRVCLYCSRGASARSPKNNNFQSIENVSTALCVLNERWKIFQQTAPLDVKHYIEKNMIPGGTLQMVEEKLHGNPILQAMFVSDAIVAGTHVWEAFRTNEDGKCCFPEWANKHYTVLNKILSN